MVALTDSGSVKAWCSITGASLDNVIASLIASVSQAIATYCGRNFGSQDYSEKLDGLGKSELWMTNRPVTAVSAVWLNGVSVAAQPSGSPFGFGFTFDSMRLHYEGGVFTCGFQNVLVNYTAGLDYSASNYADLWQAATEWVGLELEAKKHPDKKSDSLGQPGSAVYLGEMPWQVRAVVDRYRLVSPTSAGTP